MNERLIWPLLRFGRNEVTLLCPHCDSPNLRLQSAEASVAEDDATLPDLRITIACDACGGAFYLELHGRDSKDGIEVVWAHPKTVAELARAFSFVEWIS